MHAVIQTGGKQYRVSEGDVLRVEKLNADAGSSLEIKEVLLVSDGDTVKVGSPYVKGGKVTAEVAEHGRGDKIEVIKFKRRKKYRRKQGHRQDYTELKITKIAAGAARKAAASKEEKAAAGKEKKSAKPAADKSKKPAASKQEKAED